MPAPPQRALGSCRENAAGCQCCGFSCFYGVSRCLLPRPQRCEAAFLLASVGREIPAGAEAAWNHSNDTVLGELGGISRPRPPTCSVLFPKLGAVLSPWVLGIWGLIACPLTARCSSFPRLLPVGWDPRGAEVGGWVGGQRARVCVKSRPLLLQILHHFRTASIYLAPLAGHLQDSAGFGLPTP